MATQLVRWLTVCKPALHSTHPQGSYTFHWPVSLGLSIRPPDKSHLHGCLPPSQCPGCWQGCRHLSRGQLTGQTPDCLPACLLPAALRRLRGCRPACLRLVAPRRLRGCQWWTCTRWHAAWVLMRSSKSQLSVHSLLPAQQGPPCRARSRRRGSLPKMWLLWDLRGHTQMSAACLVPA